MIFYTSHIASQLNVHHWKREKVHRMYLILKISMHILFTSRGAVFIILWWVRHLSISSYMRSRVSVRPTQGWVDSYTINLKNHFLIICKYTFLGSHIKQKGTFGKNGILQTAVILQQKTVVYGIGITYEAYSRVILQQFVKSHFLQTCLFV